MYTSACGHMICLINDLSFYSSFLFPVSTSSVGFLWMAFRGVWKNKFAALVWSSRERSSVKNFKSEFSLSGLVLC